MDNPELKPSQINTSGTETNKAMPYNELLLGTKLKTNV